MHWRELKLALMILVLFALIVLAVGDALHA